MTANDTILLVEDDKDLRFAYQLILTHAGYNVLSAQNGEEALEVLRQHVPRLILLDIFMPIMDGRQFLQHLDPVGQKDYVVVVCSNTSEKAVINAVQRLGATKVVLKSSLDPSGLLSLVADYMGG